MINAGFVRPESRSGALLLKRANTLGMVVAALVCLLPAGSVARATVIGFDDGTFTTSQQQVPLDYESFRWSDGMGGRGLIAINDQAYHDTFGNTYGAPSAPYAVYNSHFGGEGGVPQLVVTRSPDNPPGNPPDFTFLGAAFSGFDFNDKEREGVTAVMLTIKGFLNGQQLYSDTITLPTGRYITFQEQNPATVDMLVLIPRDQTEFLMDNFTFSSVNPVPEPSTQVLFGTCTLGVLLGYGWVRRRRAAS